MENIEEYKQLMSTQRRVVILTHYLPDADALGSSMALATYLKKKNHQVNIITPSDYPSFLDWMDEAQEIITFSATNSHQCTQLIQQAEIIFMLDFSSISRINGIAPLLAQTNAKKCIIDHHLSPDVSADFWVWDIGACSTAELVYDFIALAGDKTAIDIKIGECIYAGLVTDTSSFKRASTTKRAHLITAELMDLGVCTNQVQRLIYDNFSLDRLHFIGYILKEKLKVIPEYRTAYFVITADELSQYHTQLGDTEGLVDYAMSIKDVVFAAIIIEKVNCVKISFRSEGAFAVNDFAQKHFGGGGHRNVAAGILKTDAQDAEKKFLELLPQYQDQLSQLVLC
jgi:phosphoesterase RecJ-like protein